MFGYALFLINIGGTSGELEPFIYRDCWSSFARRQYTGRSLDGATPRNFNFF